MRQPSLVKVAAAAGLSLGLAVGGYGIASAVDSGGSAPPAASPPPAASHRGPRPGLAAAAAALGIPLAQLRADLAGGKTIAAVAKEHNVSIDKVIDAMVADAQPRLRQRIAAEVNGTADRDNPGRHGPGHGGAPALGVAAGVIGISPDELRTAVESGQSLAQVATAHQVAPQTLIDALVKDRTARIDKAVSDGRFTQAQADRMKASLAQRVTDQVNRAPDAAAR